MLDLKANTQTIVTIGPFVDATDGLTPETGITLGGADEAELIKHGSTSVVDISGATWAAVTNADGYYSLTLTASHTDTEGQLTVIVQDDDVCLPVKCVFRVLCEAAYDSLYTAKDSGYMDVNIKAISEDTTAADNLESAYDGTGYDIGGIDVSELNTAVDAIGSDGTGLTEAGGTGDQFSAIPWNASWDAEVESEVTDVIVTNNLDTVAGTLESGVNIASDGMDSVVLPADIITAASINTGAFTADAFAADALVAATFATDSIAADALAADAVSEIQSGLSTHSAADVWSVGTRVLTAGTNLNDISAAEVNAQVDAAIETYNLDHLALTGDATLTNIVADNTVFAHLMAVGANISDYDDSTDSLEAIRDRGDADWSSGGATNPNMLLDAEVATVSSQTSFTLATGADFDDAYNDQTIVIYDDSNNDYPSVRVVTDYTGATKTVTIDSGPDFTMGTDDSVKIFATAPGTSAPTASQVADAVWDEATADHSGAGSTGKAVADILADTNELQADDYPTTLATLATSSALSTMQGNVTDILADTNELQTDWANGGRLDLILDTAASGSGDATEAKQDTIIGYLDASSDIDTNIDTILSRVTANVATASALSTMQGNVTDILADTNELQTNQGNWLTATGFLDAAGVRSAVGMSSANLDAQIAALPTAAENRDEMDSNSTQLAAIVEDTGTTIPATLSSGVAVSSLTSAAITDVWSTDTLTEAYAADGSEGTPAQILYLIQQAITEFAITDDGDDTSTVTIKQLDGSSTAATLDINGDEDTAPTSSTRAS